MHYQPGKTPHGLPYDPFKSCVVPRPIGWISTRDENGVDNLAPYSQFTNVTFDPPIVMFSANQSTIGEQKDSAYNAEKTGYFVWNMATYALKDAMNASAEELPRDIDEFERAGLTKAEGLVVPVSRVVESPVQFECRYLKTVHFPGNGTMGSADVVFGQVEMIHIDDEALTPDGKIDILKLRPLARMGYYDYTTVDSVFEMKIPGSAKMAVGLSGTAAEND